MKIIFLTLLLGMTTVANAQSLSMPFAAQTVPAGDNSQALLAFKDSDIKFSLQSLMDLLRDHRHEGWVLAAYPDPITRRPLIGAGFSLDVAGSEHAQRDALNPHLFVEPSSAQLWQAAGLAPDRLQQILEQYDRNMNAWTTKKYHKNAVRHKLTPQLTEEEATRLLRISAIQAVENAKAYCRNFDQLTASQQMALSQLVFQMGVNLEQFVDFLGALNDPDGLRELARLDGFLETESEHWQTVQNSLMDSQWARRYTIRAASVIAMFDPQYSIAPAAAEERIDAVLRPAVEPPVKSPHAAALRTASYSKRSGKAHSRRSRHSLIKHKSI